MIPYPAAECKRGAKKGSATSRFLYHVSPVVKFTTFPKTTALQHCKIICSFRSGRRDEVIAPYRCGDRRLPAYVRFTVLWPGSFHFSSAV